MVNKAEEVLASQRNPEPDQFTLFSGADAPPDWAREWEGMPEFKMHNTEPVQKITMSFKSKKDVEDFAKLVGQTITDRTDSLWFPRLSDYIAPKNFRYIDEP